MRSGSNLKSSAGYVYVGSGAARALSGGAACEDAIPDAPEKDILLTLNITVQFIKLLARRGLILAAVIHQEARGALLLLAIFEVYAHALTDYKVIFGLDRAIWHPVEPASAHAHAAVTHSKP